MSHRAHIEIWQHTEFNYSPNVCWSVSIVSSINCNPPSVCCMSIVWMNLAWFPRTYHWDSILVVLALLKSKLKGDAVHSDIVWYMKYSHGCIGHITLIEYKKTDENPKLCGIISPVPSPSPMVLHWFQQHMTLVGGTEVSILYVLFVQSFIHMNHQAEMCVQQVSFST